MPPKMPKESVRFATIVPDIQGRQVQYFEQHNEYWQGKRTKSIDTEKQTDKESWKDIGIDLTGLDEFVSVHAYNGARGRGYVIISEKEVGGGRYEKKVVQGAEQERAYDWVFIPNDII